MAGGCPGFGRNDGPVSGRGAPDFRSLWTSRPARCGLGTLVGNRPIPTSNSFPVTIPSSPMAIGGCEMLRSVRPLPTARPATTT